MRLLLFVTSLSFVSCAAAQTERGSDWPGFLGPFGTSVSSEKGIVSPWPENGLRIVWHMKAGTGYAAPTISEGKLYLFDRHDDQARLTCLDARTGKEAWRFDYPTDYQDKYNYNNGSRCCPIVDAGRVYTYGPEGMLHCVSVKNGQPIWKVDTRKDFNIIQNFFGVGSTPIIEGDLLIAQVGGSPPGSENERDFQQLKGNGTAVVAFDKATGKVRYRIGDELASYASPVLASINGRRWCFMFARGGLLAFNPADGKIDFHFPWRAEDLESVNAANPVIVGDKVLISETYGPGAALLQVRPGGYKVIWDDLNKFGRDKSLQCHWMTPVYHNGYVYGCSGRHTSNGELRCVEFETGKVMWSKPRLGRTALLMVDGHFVCLSELGPILLLKVNPKEYSEVSAILPTDPKSNEELLRYPCWAAPVLSHGLMYIRSEERLVCLELMPAKK